MAQQTPDSSDAPSRRSLSRDASSSHDASSTETESAQRTSRGPRGGGDPGARVSVFFHVGLLALTAKDSFDAILDTSSGPVYGGGAELALRGGIFVRGDVSRFKEDGERVFVFDNEVFPLGIPLTVTMTPIELTGGYRFFTRPRGRRRGGLRLMPYVGGGAGVLRYREESAFDEPDETTDERFTSYHILAGLDVPIGRHVSAGAEYLHRWVKDSLGEAGVSQLYNEKDLGGDTVRAQVRFVF